MSSLEYFQNKDLTWHFKNYTSNSKILEQVSNSDWIYDCITDFQPSGENDRSGEIFSLKTTESRKTSRFIRNIDDFHTKTA